MKRSLWLIGCAAFVAMSSALAAVKAPPTPSYVESRFSVALEGSAPYYMLTLTADVYRAMHSSSGRDLLILNGAGERVPYTFGVARTEGKDEGERRVIAPSFPLPQEALADAGESRIVGFTVSDDGQLRAQLAAKPPVMSHRSGDVIDASQIKGALRTMYITLDETNYQGKADILISDDLQRWRKVATAQFLKLTYDGYLLQQEQADLSGVRARYLQLRWQTPPPRIARVEFDVRRDALEREIPPPVARQWHNLASGYLDARGDYLFDTAGRFPVDRLSIRLPHINTVANVSVYSRMTPEQSWRLVTHSVLYRIQGPAGEQENTAIPVMSNRDRYWMLRVDQRGGGLGSGMPSLTIGWLGETLTFLARGAPPFELAAGRPEWGQEAQPRNAVVIGGAPQMAVAHVDRRIESPLPQQEKTLPLLQQEKTLPLAEQQRRMILWVVLILAVGLLGVMAWRLTKQLPKSEADDPGPSSSVADRDREPH